MSFYLTGASIFTNIFTIITVFMFWRGECASKNKTKRDNPTCLKYTLTVFIVILMATIIVYNILDLYLDVPLDETRKEAYTIINNAKNLLSDQDYFSKLRNSSDMMIVHMDNAIGALKAKLHWEELLEKEEAFDTYFGVMNKIRAELRAYIDVNGRDDCRIRRWGQVATLEYCKTEKKKLSTNIQKAKASLERINETLRGQTIEQQKLDLTKDLTYKRVAITHSILEHFHFYIDQLDNTTQKWSEATVSMFQARTNSKIIVNITFGSLLVFTILSILVIILPKFIGPKLLVKIISIVVYTTGALSLIIGLVIMLMSFRLIGSFDCPLSKSNFRLSNFTKPFLLPTGSSLSICENVDSKLFSGLEAIPSDSISDNLQISKYKEAIMNLTIDLNLYIDVPPTLLPEFNHFDPNYFNCAVFCTTSENYAAFCAPTQIFANGGKDLIAIVNVFNAERDKSFGSILDEQNKKTVLLFQESIKDINANFNAIDFSCQPIVDSFIKTMMLSTCQQYEVKTFLIPLIWTLVACLISLIMHILVYENVKLFKEKVENDQKSGQVSNTTQSPVSTTVINTKSVTPK